MAEESLIYNGGISSTISLDLPGQAEAANTKGGLTISEAVKRAEISVNKVSGEITSLAQQVDGQVSNIYSQIQQTVDQILQTVSNTYISEDERGAIIQQAVSTSISQTSNEINIRFQEASELVDGVSGDLDDYKQTIEQYIRFAGALIELGRSDSRFRAQLSNEELAFLDGSDKVAYISNSAMAITQAIINQSLTLGQFAFMPRDDGSLSFVWKG